MASLQRQWIHDPADGKSNCEEGEKNENTVTDLFAGFVFRDQGEDNGDDQGEKQQSLEMRQSHGLLP